jgi:hypothetical protein
LLDSRKTGRIIARTEIIVKSNNTPYVIDSNGLTENRKWNLRQLPHRRGGRPSWDGAGCLVG